MGLHDWPALLETVATAAIPAKRSFMSVCLFLFCYLSFFCALRAYCMSERALPANVFTVCDPGMVAGAGAALCTVTVYCFPLLELFFAFIATSFSTLTAFTLLSSPVCVCVPAPQGR